MRATLTLTSRGVVTLPAKLRRALGHRADDQLIAETTPEGLLAVGGVTRSFFERGRQRRVRLVVNGRELPFDEREWKFVDTNRYRFSRTLTSGSGVLVAGINVLEVSVVDGEGTTRRKAISFIVNTHASALDGVLSVDARASHFISTPATPLRSHETVDEQVVLRWKAGEALPLDKWRIIDVGGGFEYTFRRRHIAANGTIALVSRGSAQADTDAAVHAGLPFDVWNDADGILRAFLRYR
jgi:bifunctional DNA-binding transcriptional regulator/antitoxin component of YhaV-PrlF toxin-antitoxin module